MNLLGGLTTSTPATLAFNMNTGMSLGTGSNGNNVYGGDLINLSNSTLTVSGGKIVACSAPTLLVIGDYRLFANVGQQAPGVGQLRFALEHQGQLLVGHREEGPTTYTDLDITAVAAPSSGTWTTNGGGTWGQGSNWYAGDDPHQRHGDFRQCDQFAGYGDAGRAQSAGALLFNNLNGYTLQNGSGGPLNLGAAGTA